MEMCQMCGKEKTVENTFHPCVDCNKVLQKQNYNRGLEKAAEIARRIRFLSEISYMNCECLKNYEQAGNDIAIAIEAEVKKC